MQLSVLWADFLQEAGMFISVVCNCIQKYCAPNAKVSYQKPVIKSDEFYILLTVHHVMILSK